MKRVLAMILTLTMLFGIAACSAKEESSQTSETSGDGTSTQTPAGSEDESFKGKTLSLLMSMADSNGLDGYFAQIAAFEEKYGCKVQVESIPGGDDGENIKLVRLATDNLPDIFMSNVGAKLDEFDPVNNCLNIAEEPWVKNIAEGYRTVGTYDGGVYITPADTSNAAGVLYNTKVFEKLNLKIPQTWDEFLTCCETIKAAGIIPVAAPYTKTTNTQIPYLLNYFYVQQENPDFAQQYTKREIDLNESPAFVRGLQKLYDMANLGYLNEDFLSTGMDECALMLGKGTAAMMVIRTNILTTMENNCPDAIADIDFFPLPDEDPDVRGISYWLPMGYVINKDAKEPELAKKWCEFVTTQEGVNAYCSVITPAGTFMINGIEMPSNSYPALITAQEWIAKASCPVMEYFCRIKGSNQATITSMLASGEITPDDAVKQIMEDNLVDAQQKGIVGW